MMAFNDSGEYLPISMKSAISFSLLWGREMVDEKGSVRYGSLAVTMRQITGSPFQEDTGPRVRSITTIRLSAKTTRAFRSHGDATTVASVHTTMRNSPDKVLQVPP